MLDPNYIVHDLVTELGLTNMSAYGQGQISLNKSPDGTSWAIYFPYAGGMGYLSHVDNPALLTWTPNTMAGSTPIGVPPNSFWSTSVNPPYNQYLMDLQNYHDQQIPHLQQQVCCQTNERMPERQPPRFLQRDHHVRQPMDPGGQSVHRPGVVRAKQWQRFRRLPVLRRGLHRGGRCPPVREQHGMALRANGPVDR